MPTKKLSFYMQKLLDITKRLFDMLEPLALKTSKGSEARLLIDEADATIEESAKALSHCELRAKAGRIGGTVSRRELTSEQAQAMAEKSKEARRAQ